MHRRRVLASLAGAAALPFVRARAEAGPAASPLAVHRIATLDTRTVSLRWPRHVGKNAKLDVHGWGPSPMVVTLTTDQGATGWGQLIGGARDLERLRERVVGRAVADLFAPESGILGAELKPLDIALHDLAGVILGLPVWKMLGAVTPTLCPVYSGMIYFDDLEPPGTPAGIDRVLQNCAWDRGHGYRQLKVKIGRGLKWMAPEAGVRRDVEVVRAIAAAFPDCALLVDGNDGLTVESMIAFLDGIDGIPLFWIEEPFVESIEAWTRLDAWCGAHGRSRTLLADGEQGNDYLVLETLEAAGVLDVRLCDILGYGFTAWRELMPRLVATRTRASPHAWGSGLKTVYVAHLAAALGNTPTIEGVTCSHDDVDFGDNVVRGGRFQVSAEPGFGLALVDPRNRASS